MFDKLFAKCASTNRKFVQTVLWSAQICEPTYFKFTICANRKLSVCEGFGSHPLTGYFYFIQTLKDGKNNSVENINFVMGVNFFTRMENTESKIV